jgi:hypothetical protein
MDHSLKKLLVIVVFGAAVVSPAFARSGLNHQQRFVGSELNGHQQRLPRDASVFVGHDRNQEGYPQPAN